MTSLDSPKPLQRVQENLLAASERRLLNWLCARLPLWMTPDILTAIGMGGAALCFAGYAMSGRDPNWLWLAVLGHGVQWFGDSLDGSVARFRQIERPRFGYFIDHSCDALATLLILGGMGLSPYLRLDVMLLALCGYLMLSIHAYLSARVLGELKLSYLNAGPTELRFLLIGITVAMWWQGPEPGYFAPWSGFDLFALACALVLIVLFVTQTYVAAQRLLSQVE